MTCDDGRRGIFAGDSIIWADGTRSNLASPHPSVIIGNKSSVVIGPGVFAGNGKDGYGADGKSERAEQGALPGPGWRVVLFLRVMTLERGGSLPESTSEQSADSNTLRREAR